MLSLQFKEGLLVLDKLQISITERRSLPLLWCKTFGYAVSHSGAGLPTQPLSSTPTFRHRLCPDTAATDHLNANKIKSKRYTTIYLNHLMDVYFSLSPLEPFPSLFRDQFLSSELCPLICALY